MRSLAVQFYKDGFNCSQSILMAAGRAYGIDVPGKSFNMCNGISSGFGSGNICCALVGGVMAFGLIFDEADTKCMRIRLFDLFQEKYGAINCAALAKRGKCGCEQVVKDVAGLTQQLIEEYR